MQKHCNKMCTFDTVYILMQTQKMCIHLQFYNSQKITGILKLNFAFGTNFKMKLLNCHIMNFIEKKNKVIYTK